MTDAEICHRLTNLAGRSATLTEENEAMTEQADACPICLTPFKDDDICASDIELLTCHAVCLKGSPVVDLGTGEPIDGEADTYRYDSLAQPRAALKDKTNG